MNSIAEMVDHIGAWASPRKALHRGEESPFLLSCRLSTLPASKDEISGLNICSSLQEFWSISSEAYLFKDELYGQWGLRILSPNEAKEITSQEKTLSPDDMRDSDFIVGEFYGDSDQLLIDASDADQGNFSILIKLPIDERSEWPRVASSFGEFLERYIVAEGEKFWEI